MSESKEGSISNRGGARGRGRGRGSRGRGSRGAQSGEISSSHTSEYTPQERPTHFLCLPLKEHVALHHTISSFHSAILAASPAVENIDEGIMIDPIRMHLTLGVMALKEGSAKTVESALNLLGSLRPQINDLIKGAIISVPLKRMGVFERGKKKEAGVLWLAPKEDRMDVDVKRLHELANLVYSTFKRENYITDTRDPQLHVTVMNTTFRKPRPKFFQGFSFTSMLACTEAMNIVKYVPAEAVTTSGRESTVDIDLGQWSVPEIQLCIMGSKGPRGEYVSCGSVPL